MAIIDIEQKNSMLAAIIEFSEDAIISKDLNGTITSWNKSAEKMFGYTAQEAIGRNIELIIPEDRKEEEKLIISNLREGRPIEHFKTIRVTKFGEFVHISLTVSPIKNAWGVVTGASKIARNITRQVRDEELINQYARRLEIINAVGRKIVSHLDVPTILQTVADACTQLSGAAFGAFFYNKIDHKGEAYILNSVSGAPKEAFEKFAMALNTDVFKNTFAGQSSVRSDDITKEPGGQNSPHIGIPTGHLPVVSYLAVPVISHSGSVIGGLFFGHPKAGVFKEEHEVLVSGIAAQASIALDNAKLYEDINALNSRKDEFIGFISHELRTPLTTLKGYLEISRDDANLIPEIQPRLSRQVTRLEEIISDLLDISKIEAGKLDFSFSPIGLGELVRKALDAVNHTEHHVDFKMPSGKITVMVDIQKMTQVLVNLISNAMKYSPKGSTVKLEAAQFGSEAIISVRDEGAGIAKQELERVFNQFYRVTETKNSTQGIGLGLYISRQFVDGHLGKIWAESEVGKGSIFFVSFPAERP